MVDHDSRNDGCQVSSASRLRGTEESRASMTFRPASHIWDLHGQSGLRRDPTGPQARLPRPFESASSPRVSIYELPDRFRAIFPYHYFNLVQSRCFDVAYRTGDNLVVSAPTGSGKTAVMELAICQLLQDTSQCFKVVYQAPTKALCAERKRDWSSRFGILGLHCIELTGDSDHTHLHDVQKASIIITTPEKWDSVTRKWKDHRRLVELVKLFLIDEVHILREPRGATLEAVISRMKSIGSKVRFVALSATVPNADDVAEWLGRNSEQPSMPAWVQRFGEEARPTRVDRVVHGVRSNQHNEFAVDKVMDSQLPGVIVKYSLKKPILIFCMTRNICEGTAKRLAEWWSASHPKERHWRAPDQNVSFGEKSLASVASCGVAFHHAGMAHGDRQSIEALYLAGQISVICCTSTLSVGINLPCYLVIIKNTCTWMGTGTQEYAALDVMQMVGRAGRPQFEKSAVAVIMTKAEKAERYERIMSDEPPIESCLHLNLIEHLNAEIGLGTAYDVSSAKHWLSSTFLWVRLQKNPQFYHLDCSKTPFASPIQTLSNVVERDLDSLQEHQLVRNVHGSFTATPFGEAMARFYVKLETMKRLLALPERANVAQLVRIRCLSQAAEFEEIRLRSAEKTFYRELNKANSIKFPINADLGLTEHKVALIIQGKLGNAPLPSSQALGKQRTQYSLDTSFVFSHLDRLIRCLVECRVWSRDGATVRTSLELAQSVGAQAWDNPSLQLGQITGIGPVAVRKLRGAGVVTIDEFVDSESSRIETILSRNPPFGSEVLKAAEVVPRLMITLQTTGHPRCTAEGVEITFKSTIGFLSEVVSSSYRRQPVFVIFMAERCDGHLVDFRRIAAAQMGRASDFNVKAIMTRHDQFLSAYVMCEPAPGSLKTAKLDLHLPGSLFSSLPIAKAISPEEAEQEFTEKRDADHNSTSRSRAAAEGQNGFRSLNTGMTEADMAAVEALDEESIEDMLPEYDQDDFIDIDDFDAGGSVTRYRTNNGESVNGDQRSNQKRTRERTSSGYEEELPTLANGNYVCRHKCKDKRACKHLCCHEGLDNPPKKKPKRPAAQASHPGLPTSIQQKIGLQTRPKIGGTTAGEDRSRSHTSDSLERLSRQDNHTNVSDLALSLVRSRNFYSREVRPAEEVGRHNPHRTDIRSLLSSEPDSEGLHMMGQAEAAYPKTQRHLGSSDEPELPDLLDDAAYKDPSTGHCQLPSEQTSGLFLCSNDDPTSNAPLQASHDASVQAGNWSSAEGHVLGEYDEAYDYLGDDASGTRLAHSLPAHRDEARKAPVTLSAEAGEPVSTDELEDEISREIYDLLGPYVDFV